MDNLDKALRLGEKMKRLAAKAKRLRAEADRIEKELVALFRDGSASAEDKPAKRAKLIKATKPTKPKASKPGGPTLDSRILKVMQTDPATIFNVGYFKARFGDQGIALALARLSRWKRIDRVGDNEFQLHTQEAS